jgi:translation initiation factor 1 (eIF-1/SUI1)
LSVAILCVAQELRTSAAHVGEDSSRKDEQMQVKNWDVANMKKELSSAAEGSSEGTGASPLEGQEEEDSGEDRASVYVPDAETEKATKAMEKSAKLMKEAQLKSKRAEASKSVMESKKSAAAKAVQQAQMLESTASSMVASANAAKKTWTDAADMSQSKALAAVAAVRKTKEQFKAAKTEAAKEVTSKVNELKKLKKKAKCPCALKKEQIALGGDPAAKLKDDIAAKDGEAKNAMEKAAIVGKEAEDTSEYLKDILGMSTEAPATAAPPRPTAAAAAAAAAASAP